MRLRRGIGVLLLLGCSGSVSCDWRRPGPVRDRPFVLSLPFTQDRQDAPIAAVFIQHFEKGGPADPQVVVALWQDGTVVWSRDRLRGGRPYGSATVARDRIARIVADAAERGRLTEGNVFWQYVATSSPVKTVFVRYHGRFLYMSSCHEWAEADSGIVATARGLEPLDGRERREVLASQPPEFRERRVMWERVKATVEEAMPEAGDYSARLEFRLGRWETGSDELSG